MTTEHFVSAAPHIQRCTAEVDPETGYIRNIDDIRAAEYPSLSRTTYLDHAGTTLYAKSLVEEYSHELTAHLFGNPHSASAASQLSSRRIDDVRLQVLRFFHASPEDFDVVFVANATAAIKLVGDAFRDHGPGFWYGYHGDAHTSLVGLRELATCGSACFPTDTAVGDWLSSLTAGPVGGQPELSLLAYPAQSNMTGHRPPRDWASKARSLGETGRRIFTLLDAAALVSTSPFDLSDPSAAPDFVALSFYKIFGFPDLGALIIRKASGAILRSRKYFAGGTVDMVVTSGPLWHAKKEATLHDFLEDGTVPFHNIVALRSALTIHTRLYGSMDTISRHTHFLASRLRQSLSELRHVNGAEVCQMYGDVPSSTALGTQGPVIAFNLRDKMGNYVSNSEVEKLGIVQGIQFRTGGLCNPGGIATHLRLSPDEMRQNYATGLRCGDENDILNGKPVGAIRVSLGAMSSLHDITTFIDFIKEFYVDSRLPRDVDLPAPGTAFRPSFMVESLSVFPIKSCAAFPVRPEILWEVGPKGLAWDREWCLVHEGTNVALSQKRHPRMALIRPEIDLVRRLLQVTYDFDGDVRHLELSLDHHQSMLKSFVNTCEETTNRTSNVCGEIVDIHLYTSPAVARFFTEALGLPCTLARFPSDGRVRQVQMRIPGTPATETGRSITLTNESPILLVSRSSVNRLNEHIKRNGGVGKAVAADSFRANIVVSEELRRGQEESPYVEDQWTRVKIGKNPRSEFEILGPCQRCQMVCVDQKNAQRRQEPFSTLAKTRRKDGRVWFGMHMCLHTSGCVDGVSEFRTYLQVGDRVEASTT